MEVVTALNLYVQRKYRCSPRYDLSPDSKKVGRFVGSLTCPDLISVYIRPGDGKSSRSAARKSLAKSFIEANGIFPTIVGDDMYFIDKLDWSLALSSVFYGVKTFEQIKDSMVTRDNVQMITDDRLNYYLNLWYEIGLLSRSPSWSNEYPKNTDSVQWSVSNQLRENLANPLLGSQFFKVCFAVVPIELQYAADKPYFITSKTIPLCFLYVAEVPVKFDYDEYRCDRLKFTAAYHEVLRKVVVCVRFSVFVRNLYSMGHSDFAERAFYFTCPPNEFGSCVFRAHSFLVDRMRNNRNYEEEGIPPLSPILNRFQNRLNLD